MDERLALHKNTETLNPFEKELFKSVDSNKTKEVIANTYLSSKKLSSRVLKISWWNNNLSSTISSLDENLESKLRVLAKRREQNDMKLKSGYNEYLKDYWITFDELQTWISNVKNVKNNDEFIRKLEEMDKPLEVPLLEPIDVFLITYWLGKLWIKLTWKLIWLAVEKWWKLILSTSVWKQVVNINNLASKQLNKIVQYACENYRLTKEAIQEFWARNSWLVTEWIPNSFTRETTKVVNWKTSNVLRSEAVKEWWETAEKTMTKTAKEHFEKAINNNLIPDWMVYMNEDWFRKAFNSGIVDNWDKVAIDFSKISERQIRKFFWAHFEAVRNIETWLTKWNKPTKEFTSEMKDYLLKFKNWTEKYNTWDKWYKKLLNTKLVDIIKKLDFYYSY